MMFIIEVRKDGVWSWSNQEGAQDVTDCVVGYDEMDPDEKAEIAVENGVGSFDVRLRPLPEEEWNRLLDAARDAES